MPKNRGRADPAQAAKNEKRLERQRQEAAARHRAERRARIRRSSAYGAGALAAAAGIFLIARPDPELPGVERPASRGRDHVAVDQATYEEAAPTSGPHTTQAPACGEAAASLEPALAVHALEHGAVVIWYQPEREEELRGPLLDILSGWDSHWVLSPNARIDEPVVATAWERRQSFDEAGEDLSAFIGTYRQRGREKVPCPA